MACKFRSDYWGRNQKNSTSSNDVKRCVRKLGTLSPEKLAEIVTAIANLIEYEERKG